MRAFAHVLLCSAYVGCSQTESLGLIQPPCDAASCRDAAGEPPELDAGAPLVRERGDRFPEQGLDAYVELREQLVGTWQGSTTTITAQQGEQTWPAYVVGFAADGTFATRCSTAEPCQPFGVGSDGVDPGQRWQLVHVDADGHGWGYFSSPSSGGGPATEVELRELVIDRGGDHASFELFNALFVFGNGTPRPIWSYGEPTRVELERLPQAGPLTGDGGVP